MGSPWHAIGEEGSGGEASRDDRYDRHAQQQPHARFSEESNKGNQGPWWTIELAAHNRIIYLSEEITDFKQNKNV